MPKIHQKRRELMHPVQNSKKDQEKKKPNQTARKKYPKKENNRPNKIESNLESPQNSKEEQGAKESNQEKPKGSSQNYDFESKDDFFDRAISATGTIMRSVRDKFDGTAKQTGSKMREFRDAFKDDSDDSANTGNPILQGSLDVTKEIGSKIRMLREAICEQTLEKSQQPNKSSSSLRSSSRRTSLENKKGSSEEDAVHDHDHGQNDDEMKESNIESRSEIQEGIDNRKMKSSISKSSQNIEKRSSVSFNFTPETRKLSDDNVLRPEEQEGTDNRKLQSSDSKSGKDVEKMKSISFNEIQNSTPETNCDKLELERYDLKPSIQTKPKRLSRMLNNAYKEIPTSIDCVAPSDEVTHAEKYSKLSQRLSTDLRCPPVPLNCSAANRTSTLKDRKFPCLYPTTPLSQSSTCRNQLSSPQNSVDDIGPCQKPAEPNIYLLPTPHPNIYINSNPIEPQAQVATPSNAHQIIKDSKSMSKEKVSSIDEIYFHRDPSCELSKTQEKECLCHNICNSKTTDELQNIMIQVTRKSKRRGVKHKKVNFTINFNGLKGTLSRKNSSSLDKIHSNDGNNNTITETKMASSVEASGNDKTHESRDAVVDVKKARCDASSDLLQRISKILATKSKATTETTSKSTSLFDDSEPTVSSSTTKINMYGDDKTYESRDAVVDVKNALYGASSDLLETFSRILATKKKATTETTSKLTSLFEDCKQTVSSSNTKINAETQTTDTLHPFHKVPISKTIISSVESRYEETTSFSDNSHSSTDKCQDTAPSETAVVTDSSKTEKQSTIESNTTCEHHSCTEYTDLIITTFSLSDMPGFGESLKSIIKEDPENKPQLCSFGVQTASCNSVSNYVIENKGVVQETASLQTSNYEVHLKSDEIKRIPKTVSFCQSSHEVEGKVSSTIFHCDSSFVNNMSKPVFNNCFKPSDYRLSKETFLETDSESTSFEDGLCLCEEISREKISPKRIYNQNFDNCKFEQKDPLKTSPLQFKQRGYEQNIPKKNETLRSPLPCKEDLYYNIVSNFGSCNDEDSSTLDKSSNRPSITSGSESEDRDCYRMRVCSRPCKSRVQKTFQVRNKSIENKQEQLQPTILESFSDKEYPSPSDSSSVSKVCPPSYRPYNCPGDEKDDEMKEPELLIPDDYSDYQSFRKKFQSDEIEDPLLSFEEPTLIDDDEVTYMQDTINDDSEPNRKGSNDYENEIKQNPYANGDKSDDNKAPITTKEKSSFKPKYYESSTSCTCVESIFDLTNFGINKKRHKQRPMLGTTRCPYRSNSNECSRRKNKAKNQCRVLHDRKEKCTPDYQAISAAFKRGLNDKGLYTCAETIPGSPGCFVRTDNLQPIPTDEPFDRSSSKRCQQRKSCCKCSNNELEKQTRGFACNKSKSKYLRNVSKTLPYKICNKNSAAPREKVCFKFEPRPCFKTSSQEKSVSASKNIYSAESSVDLVTCKSCFKRKRSSVSDLPYEQRRIFDAPPNKSYCHKRPSYSNLPELPDLSDVDCCLSASIGQVESCGQLPACLESVLCPDDDESGSEPDEGLEEIHAHRKNFSRWMSNLCQLKQRVQHFEKTLNKKAQRMLKRQLVKEQNRLEELRQESFRNREIRNKIQKTVEKLQRGLGSGDVYGSEGNLLSEQSTESILNKPLDKNEYMNRNYASSGARAAFLKRLNEAKIRRLGRQEAEQENNYRPNSKTDGDVISHDDKHQTTTEEAFVNLFKIDQRRACCECCFGGENNLPKEQMKPPTTEGNSFLPSVPKRFLDNGGYQYDKEKPLSYENVRKMPLPLERLSPKVNDHTILSSARKDNALNNKIPDKFVQNDSDKDRHKYGLPVDKIKPSTTEEKNLFPSIPQTPLDKEGFQYERDDPLSYANVRKNSVQSERFSQIMNDLRLSSARRKSSSSSKRKTSSQPDLNAHLLLVKEESRPSNESFILYTGDTTSTSRMAEKQPSSNNKENDTLKWSDTSQKSPELEDRFITQNNTLSSNPKPVFLRPLPSVDKKETGKHNDVGPRVSAQQSSANRVLPIGGRGRYTTEYRDSFQGSLKSSFQVSPRDSYQGSPRGSIQGTPRGSIQETPRGSIQGTPRGSKQGIARSSDVSDIAEYIRKEEGEDTPGYYEQELEEEWDDRRYSGSDDQQPELMHSGHMHTNQDGENDNLNENSHIVLCRLVKDLGKYICDLKNIDHQKPEARGKKGAAGKQKSTKQTKKGLQHRRSHPVLDRHNLIRK